MENSAAALRRLPHFLAFPMEKKFNPVVTVEFARNNWPLCIAICALYIVMITAGPRLMENRPAYSLKFPLACWNALLCAFSFIGMVRTAPELSAMILTQPYKETICTAPYETWGYGPTGMWVMLFIYSKVPELVDTVFLILRKRKVIFLHWYHHVSVLLFCWNAFSTLAATGLYFVAMNYTVHAIMYGYYCLQALECLPKSFPTFIITTAQIAQMFVGTGVCISAWYYMLKGETCSNDHTNLIAGAIMYGSYLYLFVEFALKRFGSKNAMNKAKKNK